MNRHMRALMTGTLTICALSPIFGHALGPSGSGGGGPQAANFQSSARIIAEALNRDQKATDQFFGMPEFGASYSAAIDNTEVICATGETLKSMQKNLQKAFFDGLNTIHLDCKNYGELERTGPDKYVVVFHEYMRKLRVESSDYRYSSKLPLFIFPTMGKRAIDAFCAGGWRDKFQLENYIAQMLQEKTMIEETAKTLREAVVNNMQFSDANGRILATWLGWNKDNQYPWVVEMTCLDKDESDVAVDPSDTSMNDRKISALEGLSGARLAIKKEFTIPRGRASVAFQNGRMVTGKLKLDYYQSFCEFAHDTDARRDTKIKAHNVQARNIGTVDDSGGSGTDKGSQVNFSLANDSLTDVQVWMPGDVNTIERLRSVLNSCGVKLDLKNLTSAATAQK
jgi:hypothetical protein